MASASSLPRPHLPDPGSISALSWCGGDSSLTYGVCTVSGAPALLTYDISSPDPSVLVSGDLPGAMPAALKGAARATVSLRPGSRLAKALAGSCNAPLT